MDLELLRTFLEVNRTRHFGEAAEALHLTQAAMSARISSCWKARSVYACSTGFAAIFTSRPKATGS